MPKLKRPNKAASSGENHGLKRSKLAVFDIPDELLIDSPDNPQEMDDATLDELVEGIRREGVDEPLHVIPFTGDDGEPTGQYMITSGHHRRKAGKIAGIRAFPCVIKPNEGEAARKIALVRRNQLHGNLNRKKFTDLFREVAPVLGQETTKRLMGFTKEAAFKKLIDDVGRSLGPERKAQLDSAKETVKSVDDLSSIINGIFKKEGSKVQKGYAVFSFGGKKHHYFQIDTRLHELLEEIEQRIEDSGMSAATYLTDLFTRAGVTTPGVQPKTKHKKIKLKSKKNG